MASIRILQFAGIRPELSARLLPAMSAQIAHNCILTDGSLRPQAKWVQLQEYDAGNENPIKGIAYDSTNDVATMYMSFDPITLEGEPFASRLTVGASPASLVNWYYTGESFAPHTVAVYPGGVSATVSYQRSYDSIKPVNRVYALTRVRRIGTRTEEGPLIPIPGQAGTDIVYEGDLVTVEINAATLDDGATNVNIYRTISGLDTGVDVTNNLDTNWHLVDQLPLIGGNLISYIDGNSATAVPLDVCYSQNFHPPALVARYMGLSESGWFVAGAIGGDIQISERYLHHAWPVDNHLRLQGEEITDLAVHRDNIYVGTLRAPYVVSLSAGENGLQASATPFPEAIPCRPNTLTPAAGGAIYASGQGLVALSREGQQVITRDVVNAGDILYSKTLEDGRVSTARISTTSFGTYFQGKYIGFCEGPPLDDNYYVTTTPYPVESIEGIGVTSEYAGALSVEVEVDNFTVSSSFEDGMLRDILQVYPMPPEEDGSGLHNTGIHFTVTSTYEDGTLYDIRRTTEMPPEQLVPGAFLAGGSLETILVQTEYVEQLVPGAFLVSGTLT